MVEQFNGGDRTGERIVQVVRKMLCILKACSLSVGFAEDYIFIDVSVLEGFEAAFERKCQSVFLGRFHKEQAAIARWTFPFRRFIGGLPIKPATKRFSGCR